MAGEAHKSGALVAINKGAIVEVVRAGYLDGYRLSVVFSDGHVQEEDFEPFLRRSLHPEISKYLNLDLFKEFRIVNGQLDWHDYDLCFPLEDLYKGVADDKETRSGH